MPNAGELVPTVADGAVGALSDVGKEASEAKKAIVGARIDTLMNYPFFGGLLIRLRPIQMGITTAGTDGRNLYYDPGFFLELSPSSRVFVMAHEVMHCILESSARRGRRKPDVWNWACDFAINQILVDVGMKPPKEDEMLAAVNNSWTMRGVPGSKKPRKSGILLDKKYAGMLAEQIYDLLVDDINSGKIKTEYYTLDQHGEDMIDDAVADAWRSAAMEQAMREAGKTPKGLDRLLESLKTTKVNWRSFLAGRLNVRTNDYSWYRPDPALFWQGITIPGIEETNVIRVGAAVDLSGSIGGEESKDFFSELVGICRQFENWSIELVTFDAEVYPPVVYDSSQDDFAAVFNHPKKGGGGTLFRPVLEHFMGDSRDDLDHVIVFTDGFSADGWGEDLACGVPILWIVHGRDNVPVPPWGHWIKYDPFE